MRKTAALVMLILLPLTSYSTCIVIVNYFNIIYAGADSARTLLLLNKTESICKLHSVKERHFAVAAFADFQCRDVAFDCLKREKDFLKSIRLFSKEWPPKLIDLLQQSKAYDSVAFSKQFSGNTASEITFFGFLNGKPFIYVLKYVVKNVHNSKLQLETIKLENPPVIVMGEHSMENLAYNPNFWSTGPIIGIKNIIEQAIKTGNGHVLPPIDILKVTPKEMTWIQKKSFCN